MATDSYIYIYIAPLDNTKTFPRYVKSAGLKCRLFHFGQVKSVSEIVGTMVTQLEIALARVYAKIAGRKDTNQGRQNISISLTLVML